MFKHPFSFEGRIGRKEYGITFLAYATLNLTISEIDNNEGSLWSVLMVIPAMWIMIAQGSKRCHDLNKNGGWQVIPFYFFWMFFQKGDSTANEYGLPNSHPKDGPVASLDEEIDSIGKKDIR